MLSLPDTLRVLAVLAYAALITLTIMTMVFYFRAQAREKQQGVLRAGGLLPSHVVSLGLMLVFFATEAVAHNIARFGSSWGPYTLLNPVLFTIAAHGMWTVTRFEWRRYRTLTPRPRLPCDPP